MKLEQFAMERMQSTYENLVEFNLSESGVRPLTPRELVEDAEGLDGLLDQPLVYSQSNGTIELRQAIASLYPGAGIDHIEVTNGGSEANFLATLRLDRVPEAGAARAARAAAALRARPCASALRACW